MYTPTFFIYFKQIYQLLAFTCGLLVVLPPSMTIDHSRKTFENYIHSNHTYCIYEALFQLVCTSGCEIDYKCQIFFIFSGKLLDYKETARQS